MKLGGDLADPRLMWLKAAGFAVIALMSAGLILLEHPSLQCAVLLALTVWASCRLYYFAFYVIERYIDPGYKFAGLGSFVAYALRRKREDPR